MIDKPILNVVFVGQYDSGKSTLAGRLLHTLGTVNDSTFERIKMESANLGKASFCYANILARTKMEMERGVTIHIAHNSAETNHYRLNIIDVPGHQFYMKNIIRGVSQANVGIVVVDAQAGSFEAGLSHTSSMLMTSKSMGVVQIIVVVNKMDGRSVNYSETRFMEIQTKVSSMAKGCGYTNDPICVPISAWSGENVTESCDKMSWYKGPCLLDALNSLKVPNGNDEKPLRIPILEIYNLEGVGTVVFGKIESGILKLDTKLRFTPQNKIHDATIGSIQVFRNPVSQAKSGEMVTIKLNDVKYEDVKTGMILSDANNNPAREVISFESEVTILCHSGIQQNYKPTFHFYTLQTRCSFQKLIETALPDGSQREENPTLIKQGFVSTVLLQPDHPLYLEPFDSLLPPFGRFIMRDSVGIVGVGIVKKVNYADE